MDRDGCTPLHYLCEADNEEMIKQLIPLCPSSKDVRNRYGRKPADMGKNKLLAKLIRDVSGNLRKG